MTASPTSWASTRPTTSRARTTTPTSTSRPWCRCSPICPAIGTAGAGARLPSFRVRLGRRGRCVEGGAALPAGRAVAVAGVAAAGSPRPERLRTVSAETPDRLSRAIADFGGFLDPCEAGSAERGGPDAAQVEALCVAQGVPAGAAGRTSWTRTSSIEGVAGGNPDLDPETGDTLTVGFVWTSRSSHPLWSGMQVSVDWYRIESRRSDRVGVRARLRLVVLRCADQSGPGRLERLVQSVRARPCDRAKSRTSRTSSSTSRAARFPAPTCSSTGASPQDPATSASTRSSRGWTLTRRCRRRACPRTENVGLVGGLIGASFPEWKSNLQAQLSIGRPDGRLAVAFHRFDAGQQSGSRTIRSRATTTSTCLPVTSSTKGVLDGLTVRAGSRERHDEDPPLLPSAVQANTDPSQYDVLGRRYYFNVSYRF